VSARTDANVAGPDVATPAAEPLTAEPLHRARFASWVSAGLLVVSVLLAGYTGFRLPNLWSVTLMSVSITDGFHRRFLVGTLLRPIAEQRHFTYWFYAAVAFAVLAALVALLVVAALRATLLSQRFLVIAFFLLPTGGYLFHEVGYLDQVLYVLLFASLFAVRRSWWWAAPVLMTLTVVTHELALVTVVPIYAFVALRHLPLRRAVGAVVPPAVVGAIVLLVAPSEDRAIAGVKSLLAGANWQPRADALSLFGRTQSQSLDLYSAYEVFYFLIPAIVIVLVAAVLLYLSNERGDRGAHLASWPRATDWAYAILAILAILAPVILIWGGWDKWRWGFLLFANFLIVVWWWIGDLDRELDTIQLVILAAALLMTAHVNLRYFDLDEPRDLSAENWRELRHEIEDGSFFDIPAR
jgi:hypothetical protein